MGCGFVMVLQPELLGVGAAEGISVRVLQVGLGLFDMGVILF